MIYSKQVFMYFYMITSVQVHTIVARAAVITPKDVALMLDQQIYIWHIKFCYV